MSPAFWLAHRVQFEQLAARALQGLPLVRVRERRFGDRDYNAAVGGEPMSQHLIGTAGDWAGSEAAMAEGKRRWERIVPQGYATMHDVGSGLHLHLQLFKRGIVPRSVYDAIAGTGI